MAVASDQPSEEERMAATLNKDSMTIDLKDTEGAIRAALGILFAATDGAGRAHAISILRKEGRSTPVAILLAQIFDIADPAKVNDRTQQWLAGAATPPDQAAIAALNAVLTNSTAK
jgi:hypothetical protein